MQKNIRPHKGISLVNGLLLLAWFALTLFILTNHNVDWWQFLDFLLLSATVFCLGLSSVCLAASGYRTAGIAAFLNGIFLAFFLAVIAFGTMYYAGLGIFISKHDIFSILQSDVSESLNFFSHYMYRLERVVVAAGVFIVSLTIIRANIRRARANSGARGRKKLIWISVLLLGLGITAFAHITAVNFAYFKFYQYHRDLRQFQRLYANLAKCRPTDAVKREKGELYVMVIGESQNKKLMSCYGAPVSSTPWLSSQRQNSGFIFLENTYSSHVLTMPALRTAFFDGNMRVGDTFPEGQNLINVMRGAGFRTVWLSNQMDLGRRDNDVSAMAQTSDTCIFTPKVGPDWRLRPAPDEILLPYIEDALNQLDSNGNTLLIIHLMGNHSPAGDRYPADFKADLPDEGVLGASFAHAREMDSLRQYLISLQYADHVLKRITELVRAHEDKPVAMVYFSDHGEEILNNLDGGHNPAVFTWDMARIPFFFWTSGPYRERYPDRAANLSRNAAKAYCNDLIFDLFLGLANIKTADYNPELDISSGGYEADPTKLTIFNDMPVSEDPLYGR